MEPDYNRALDALKAITTAGELSSAREDALLARLVGKPTMTAFSSGGKNSVESAKCAETLKEQVEFMLWYVLADGAVKESRIRILFQGGNREFE